MQDHQPPPQLPSAAAAYDNNDIIFERRNQVRTRCQNGRRQAEEQPGEHRYAKREAEQAQVRFDFKHRRNSTRRQEAKQNIRPPAGKHQPQRSTQHGE